MDHTAAEPEPTAPDVAKASPLIQPSNLEVCTWLETATKAERMELQGIMRPASRVWWLPGVQWKVIQAPSGRKTVAVELPTAVVISAVAVFVGWAWLRLR